MRKANIFLLTQGAFFLLFALTFLDAFLLGRGADPSLRRNVTLVISLDLTDLSLFTEARYTRHPSQADLYSAFQDHPSSLEHFPSGSLVPPPTQLSNPHEPGSQAEISH